MNKPFKDKKGKLRFDLIPPEFDKAFAEVATFGIEKLKNLGVENPERNWETGLKYLSDHLAAHKRHVNSWEMGIDFDMESKLHHLKHALWHLGAVVTQIDRGRIDLDDRPKTIEWMKTKEKQKLEDDEFDELLNLDRNIHKLHNAKLTISTQAGTAEVKCGYCGVNKLNDDEGK